MGRLDKRPGFDGRAPDEAGRVTGASAGGIGASENQSVSDLRALPDRLDSFQGYRKARELFDLLVHDVSPLARDPACGRLMSQQIASADSICANIEEGFGRGTRKEFVQFLIYARGSARETRGRCERFHHWIARDVLTTRIALCSEIIAILNKSITRLRS